MPVATSIISASVGRGGVNLRSDVEIIQRLLNLVPLASGGPTPLLGVDSLCGPKTCAAISRFQTVHFGQADGRVDPGYRTLEILLALLEKLSLLSQAFPRQNGGVPAPGVPLPGIPAPQPPVSSLRAEILKWAQIGAEGPYGDVGGSAKYGITSDYDIIPERLPNGQSRPIRRGWKNYKEFFDVAVHSWTERHWTAPGYLDSVKVPGKRVPVSPGSDKGLHWCGIFATWCWIKAGKNTKWMSGAGPTNAERVWGNQGIQPGDMCVQSGGLVHHFIATEINGDEITGVNGNSTAQSILIKTVNRSTVAYYYQPE